MREKVRLILHDDGSLSEHDIDLFAALSPTWIRRSVADETMNERLARWPACRDFRGRHPFALKLLDVWHFSSGDFINYCDSDVLFFRKVKNFFRPSQGFDAVFSYDFLEGYSIRALELLRAKRRLVSRLNAGIFSAQK